jgi:hypothetical protein
MKKQREMLKKIIKEELFYRDFYRASDLLMKISLQMIFIPRKNKPNKNPRRKTSENNKIQI